MEFQEKYSHQAGQVNCNTVVLKFVKLVLKFVQSFVIVSFLLCDTYNLHNITLV